MKVTSIVKMLSDSLSGKWKYDGQSRWYSKDGRHVARVKTCLCDSECDCERAYFLYGDGVPKRVMFSNNGVSLIGGKNDKGEKDGAKNGLSM